MGLGLGRNGDKSRARFLVGAGWWAVVQRLTPDRDALAIEQTAHDAPENPHEHGHIHAQPTPTSRLAPPDLRQAKA
jgi:hypothetical protein